MDGNRAISLITSQLESLGLSSQSDLLILGDFNINYQDRNLLGFKLLKELEKKYLLHQVIETPTRIHNNCKSLIDLILTNINNIRLKGTIDLSISDHLPVYIVIKKVKKPKKILTVKGRSFRNYNIDKYQQTILKDNKWKTFWLSPDVNTKWKLFYEIVCRAADQHCPLVSMKFNIDADGWITKEVLESIVEKNRLFKIARTNQTTNDWQLFKIHRKYSRNLLLHTKEEFLKNQMEIDKGNPRAFWRKLNAITGNTKDSHNFRCIFNDAGVKVEKSEAAEFMNNYFTNIGEVLNENNHSTWKCHDFFEAAPKTDGLLLNVVDENIVKKYVRTLEITKPSGIHNLNNKLLCDAFKVLAFELTAIFNDSIIQETFPHDWKRGTITPIPKPGNSMLKTNWCPITILSTPGKLLEKIIHYQTSNYLCINEILSDDQHGFRKNFSTSSAIMELLTDVYNAKIVHKTTGCVFVDYQKAFDTINHNILFSKLALYGFSKSCINWFRSYLGERTQITNCENTYYSTPKPVSIGVPQGSTLGPLLFILYVNDLCHIKHVFDVNIKMYADDTVIYSSGTSVCDVQKTLQSCLDYVYKWCLTNRLYMNMKKTKIMWFESNDAKNNVHKDYLINIDGTLLSRVYSYPYLGVELDHALSYDKHLDNVVNKTTQKLFIFRKIRRFINQSTAVIIYKQMILPLLEYCSFLTNSGKKSKIDKVDKVQSKCIRIIENCHDVYSRAKEAKLCERFNIDLLQRRRDIQLACTMFRLSKNESFIDQEIKRENLRSENKLKFICPFTKIEKIRKSPFYRGVDLWNTLKVEHHRAENKKRFKLLLKNSL